MLKPPDNATPGAPGIFASLQSGTAGGVISVTDPEYGAAGDGTTDDLQAFRDAYATGQPIFVPEGRFRLTAQATVAAAAGGTTPLELRGAGRGKTTLLLDGDVRLLNIGQALGTATSLTVTAAAGATSLTVTSTTGITADDWVQIKSMAVAP